jgi:hypothetical protein
MNIFILSKQPEESARLLCDKHISKMVVESAQMLSTAHRMLDGSPIKIPGKRGSYYLHPDSILEAILYKAVHMHHPCTKWTMVSNNNYTWHYSYFIAMCNEYTFRYGRVHKTHALLGDVLRTPPRNIEIGPKTQFVLAMNSNPECMFPNDPVKSYRMFYQTKQDRFKMVWTKRDVPEWFTLKS